MTAFRLVTGLSIAACVAYSVSSLFQHSDAVNFHLLEFAKLPVLANGRIKPLDTVARNSLMIIHGRQTVRIEDGRTLSAIEWLAEVLLEPETANDRRVFAIRNPDILSALGWTAEQRKYFSFAEFVPHLSEIKRQTTLARQVDAQLRSPFQRDIVELYQRMSLYFELENSLQIADTSGFRLELGELIKIIRASSIPRDSELFRAALNRAESLAESSYFFPVPPRPPETDPQHWRNIGQSLLDLATTGSPHPALWTCALLASAYSTDDPVGFREALTNYYDWLAAHFAPTMRKANVEVLFNTLQPFHKAMVLYVFVFLLACTSWLVRRASLGRYALLLLYLAFAVHSIGIIIRIYIEGRPPVTNLYSSAVFVGWGSVLLCVLLERILSNGIGSGTASIIGFSTLLIAHHLSMDGDTMEMLRAVLDSNGWLATHVVCVTLGYSATFLAGFLALAYIARGLSTTSLNADMARALSRMVYGTICFATLFSFVGTILGGIWADQSWGRFWGWDPKENGALLVVMWNAIILHSRWGGLVGQRGLMVMAVFGNVVTSWSWFGVNMLGVGLHSYGFMNGGFHWMIGFAIIQLLFMGLGSLPTQLWRSRVTNAQSHSSRMTTASGSRPAEFIA